MNRPLMLVAFQVCRRQSQLLAQSDAADTEMQHFMDAALADVAGWTP